MPESPPPSSESENGETGITGPGEETTPGLPTPDPLSETSTLVEFAITVPAYQSSELQVSVVWGELDVNAAWVGDEHWSISTDLPIDTEHMLTVTLYDDFGAMPLARGERPYRTGSNASETVIVPAESFDRNPFDQDQDGVSNLDEVINGTDPSVDEDALLEIIDFTFVNSESRMSVGRDFEWFVGTRLPHAELFVTPEGSSDNRVLQGSVFIDQAGNGTLTRDDSYFSGSDYVRTSGTRSRDGNAITWSGTRRAHSLDDYNHSVDFVNEVSLQTDGTWRFVQDIEGRNVGTFRDTWHSSSDLTAEFVSDYGMCLPVAGTVTIVETSNRSDWANPTVIQTSISKVPDDTYWRMSRTVNGEPMADVFVRNLYINATNLAEKTHDWYFACRLRDIE